MLPWNKKINVNYEDMESNLIKNASSLEEVSDEDKYYHALEEISKAAEIFEEAGLSKVSSLLDDVLINFAKSKKLKEKKDSEKYVKNYKKHGWMFDKSDADDISERSNEYLTEKLESGALTPEEEDEIRASLDKEDISPSVSLVSHEGPDEYKREEGELGEKGNAPMNELLDTEIEDFED